MVKRPYAASDQSWHDEHRTSKRPRIQKDRLSLLSDELLLRVFSHASLADLITTQRVSRRLRTICDDPQLWKALYYDRFVRPRTRWLSSARKRSLETEKHSARLSRWLDEANLILKGQETDWKWQYKLRLNWSIGRAEVSNIPINLRFPVAPVLARLHCGVIFTADKETGLRAWSYRQDQRLLSSIALGSAREEAVVALPTTIAVDVHTCGKDIHIIAIGFDDGSFEIYRYSTKASSFEMICHYTSAAGIGLTASSLAENYLATVDETQALRIWSISNEESERSSPKLLASLKSHTIWPPLALCMRLQNDELVISIAYPVPTYTAGWSVGVQELRLKADGVLISSRLASAVDQMFRPLSESDQPSTGGESRSPPTSLSYCHPYLLTAHSDNTMTLYMVSSTAARLTIGTAKRLWGHTSSIFGAQVGKRGKAVSVSVRGDEVRVWDLEKMHSRMQSGRSAVDHSVLSVQVTPDRTDRAEGLRSRGRDAAEGDETTTQGYVGFDDISVVVVRERARAAVEQQQQQQALTVYDFA